jgi:hypothetical protein
MTDYLLGILGIVVSVGLFLIGYRQTIGAKKERIAVANAELEKILIRRIVLEKYTPSQLDLSRLIEGKARDYRVRPAELLSETQLLNTIYTRVVESDLIPAEQREEILERIAPVLSASEVTPVQEQLVEEVASSRHIIRNTQVAITLMAILTSIVGGVVSVIPGIRSVQVRIPEVLPTLLGTIVGSLGVIAVLYTIFRLRASQEESPSKASELSRYFEFEEQVRKVLESTGVTVQHSGTDRGYDFLVERDGKKILVAVKAWQTPFPGSLLGRSAGRLRETAQRNGASEAIIVTSLPISNAKQLGVEESVKVMTLRELRNYLAHIRS